MRLVVAELYLSEPFASLWQDKDPFEEVEKLKGEVYRELDGRRTLRFEVEGKGYFLKLHRGVGWKEITKNLIQLRLPVIGAENEWRAIDKLKSLQVDTMTYVAYGKRGINPAKQLSFIITEDLAGCISLEDYCKHWPEQPSPLAEKRALIKKVAWMAKQLHDNGVNHRDFYICHFLLDETTIGDNPRLHLIDLHRAQIRKKIPYRWRLKDVAGLWFSAMDIGLSWREQCLFVKAYSGLNVKDALEQQGSFWGEVTKKARRLYSR